MVTLLVGGTYVNRNSSYKLRFGRRKRTAYSKAATEGADVEDQPDSRSSLESGDSGDPFLHGSQPSSPSLLAVDHTAPWRERELKLWTFRTTVRTPNSRQFKDRWFSRILRKYPFMQEAFYWALIYWVSIQACSQQRFGSDMPVIGLSARSCLHRPHTGRIDRRRRSSPRSSAHPHRAITRDLLGTSDPAVLLAASYSNALDQQNILIHSHPRHNPLPRLAVLSYHDPKSHI